MISLLPSISCTPHEQKPHQLRSRTMQPEYPDSFHVWVASISSALLKCLAQLLHPSHASCLTRLERMSVSLAPCVSCHGPTGKQGRGREDL